MVYTRVVGIPWVVYTRIWPVGGVYARVWPVGGVYARVGIPVGVPGWVSLTIVPLCTGFKAGFDSFLLVRVPERLSDRC